MKVSVVGLWHLGSVTAACLAAAGHEVTAYDPAGRAPIFEPGLDDLIEAGVAKGTLRFTTDPSAVHDSEIVWITYDTPVDDDDNADVDFVIRSVESLYPFITEGALILISSQLPVGSTALLETSAQGRGFSFAYSPENLRLGKAIDVFTHPDRVVAGVRDPRDRDRITRLFAPFTDRIEWMSVESAEMTKHALNAFLAMSVAFINEIAAVCENTGADAKEVERGLKSEKRIGPSAYLGPGAAFAGGTLARDVVFLSERAEKIGLPAHLLRGVKRSNDAHRSWAARRLREVLGGVAGKQIAIWGLTYKPGTDTLRRSLAIELCQSLVADGARIRAHDPAVKSLPDDLSIELASTAIDAVRGADALVVMTEWPDYRQIESSAVADAMKGQLILDANRFLQQQFCNDPRVVYATVGKALP
ncbi:MAG TPA: nucleotide sugar dehydrogenase [Thermoanaerobaculia bacterium]